MINWFKKSASADDAAPKSPLPPHFDKLRTCFVKGEGAAGGFEGNPHPIPDGTTGETTSHPTKQPQDGCQVVGYSHSTKLPNDGSQVAGYPPKGEGSIVLSPSGGKIDRGLGTNETLREIRVNESEALKDQGNTHLSNGKLIDAAECYRLAIACNPRYAEAYTNLGFVFQAQGNLNEAVLLYRKAIELNPSLLMAHQNLGFALLNLGQSDAAEESLRRVIALAPEHVGALQSLGAIAAQRGDLTQAEALLRRALELQPDYADAYNNLGNLLKQTNRLPEAEKCYRRALELNPDCVEARNHLANISLSAPSKHPWQELDADLHFYSLRHDYAPAGLLEMVAPPPREVLDVGCFCGGSGEWLKKRFPDVRLTGIEMLDKAANEARKKYDTVLVSKFEDVETSGWNSKFDAIIAADVLEHLYNPWAALERLKPLLTPGGAIYISLPNIRNLNILMNLAEGKWSYAKAGILDVTHIRFFTKAQILEMLQQTGWSVSEIRVNLDPSLSHIFKDKDMSQINCIKAGKVTLENLKTEDVIGLLALQFFIRATPLNHS